ncbi:DNA replication and repair protein RecF [bacterium]|nr:DNA replication and repair protein RecF [bacterium]
MRLERLRLKDFRNHEQTDVSFPPGIIVLTGPNGAGKSNLLEAIHYLSYLRSFRAGQDREVVRFGTPFAAVEAKLLDDAGRPFEARLVLKGGQRYVRLNGSDVTKFQDFIGRLASQFFYPGELALLTGDPGLRREVLDLELLRLKPALAPVYKQYHSALLQRNKTLKLIHPAPGQRRRDSGLDKALAAFTQQLVSAGTQIMRERRGLVGVVDGHFSPLYESLAPPGGEKVSLRYLSSVELSPDDQVAAHYAQRLAAAADKESTLRYTTVGPHRDDLGFILNDSYDLRRYGSQGQMRSAVLAFRLALCELSRLRLSDDPILLLDDALSEMDDERKKRLLKLCRSRSQVFISSASQREVELIAPLASAVYSVEQGQVRLVKG